MIELRELSPDDWTIWRELRLAALADAPYAFGSRLADWQGEGDREERWRARLAIPGSYTVAAVFDGVPVGMAGGVRDGESVVQLVSMWVSPAARGHGVGDRLMAAVEAWARDIGATVVRLTVAEGNGAASALYERHGFRWTGARELMPDGVRQEFVMEKVLRDTAVDES